MLPPTPPAPPFPYCSHHRSPPTPLGSCNSDTTATTAPAAFQRRLPYAALVFVNAAFSGWHVLGKLALNHGEACTRLRTRILTSRSRYSRRRCRPRHIRSLPRGDGVIQTSHPFAPPDQVQVLSSVLLLIAARITHRSLLPVPVYTR